MLSEILRSCRNAGPLVHCITNYVSMNDCANLLLASGASPIMAEDPEEAAEIASMCAGLVLNLGMPNPRKIEAMLLAGCAANERNRPVVFDPVGVGSSKMRMDAAMRLMDRVKVSVIRGNASEIRSLADGSAGHRGVDADSAEQNPHHYASLLARRSGAVVLLTGEQDIITDGRTSFRVQNGHPMMRFVTGTGCQLSALAAAYAAANPDNILHSALAASCAMGICGERAHRRLCPEDGNAAYRTYIIDALFNLLPDDLEREARYYAF